MGPCGVKGLESSVNEVVPILLLEGPGSPGD